MAKIASSCENCIWGKRYAAVEKPMSAKEIWEKRSFTQKLFSDYRQLKWEVAVREGRYDQYMNYRLCTRFPEDVMKHNDDFCGEHSQRPETMTEKELFEGLDKLNGTV